MRQELDEALVRDFPFLYADRNASMMSTCMCWGFPGDGWEPLLRSLSEKLEPIIAAMPDDCDCGHPRNIHGDSHCVGRYDDDGSACVCEKWRDGRPRATQVKEKFGTLRFYMSTSTEEMEDFIEEAERASAVTCEHCGSPGRVRRGGWLLALCDECCKEKGRDWEEDWDEEDQG